MPYIDLYFVYIEIVGVNIRTAICNLLKDDVVVKIKKFKNFMRSYVTTGENK